jgi:hypothetical protein
MGRRSEKSSPATGTALPVDTVGMTILPGRSMPVWAEPAAEASRLPAPELIADAPEPAVAAFAGAQVPAQEWASAAESGRAPVDQAATSMEPAFAMAGATQVGAPPAAEPAVYGNPSHAYPQEPARYPAAPAAGLATTATPSTHVDQNTPMTAPVPEAPSTEWKSPARPELSPEHVALLSWWADMIAAGQFPAPPGTLTTEVTAPAKQPRRAFPVKAAALGLVAVAAIGAAAVVGPKVMAADEPVVVPATDISLPAAVGGLVAITDPAIGTQLEPLLGFGLRPAGVTVTGAYGTTAENPLALAAMATTMGAPAEAVGQIATWAERTGATVTPSVAGIGADEGITCAEVVAVPQAQPGSFCVWTASGRRGQTYSVGISVEDALTLTNELRSRVTGA